MTLLTKINKYLNYISCTFPFRKKYKHIFIFSHKRGRTTLLSHILGSHEKICGYRELHCRYTSQIDLLKSRVALFQDKDSFLNSDFLLDKILHNEWQFDEKITGEASNYYLFVLRDPEETMLSMLKRHIDVSGPNNLHIQADYYIARLNELARMWSSLQGNKLYIDSDEIIQNTDACLVAISSFLQLKKTLDNGYQTFSQTGKAGVGDMSGNIRKGKIIREEKAISTEDLVLLNNVDMESVVLAYEATKKVLSS